MDHEQSSNSLGNSNTHRSLRQLVLVDAWFRQDKAKPNRFTLHADVSFNEERLGGGPKAEILFKISVKRCEIVFVRPSDAFSVDRSSVKRPKRLPSGEMTSQRKTKVTANAGVKGVLSLNPTASAYAELEGSHEREVSSTFKYNEEPYNERLVKSKDGRHDAWRVDGSKVENGRLDGPVFDAETEPRLTMIDLRDANTKLQDERIGFEPCSSIRVQCLREDIDIYDINYKDPEKQSLFNRQKNRNQKELLARQILREAIFSEGLYAGDLLNDPYAEMIICDATIPVIDRSD